MNETLVRQRNQSYFIIKTLIWFFGMFLGVGLFYSDNMYILLTGFFLSILTIAHGIELQHQALHLSGFNSKIMNRFFGFLFGLPLLISFSHYRDRHFHHHKYVGTEKDAEFFEYSNQKTSLIEIIKNLFMINHFLRVFAIIIQIASNRKIDVYNENNLKAIKFDYSIFMILISFYIVLCTFFHSLLWLALLPIFSAPIHVLIELPEHYKTSKSHDILKNTRTIKSNFLMTWFTNGNNYHVEHHLYPSAIPENFKKINIFIDGKIENKNVGYIDFILNAVLK